MGSFLASSGDDGNVAVWNASTGARVGQPLRGHGELVTDIAFTAPRKLISAAGAEVARWDLDSVSLGRKLDAHQGALRTLAVSPDESEFLTGGSDVGVVKRWKLASMAQAGPPVVTGLRRVDWIEWERGAMVTIAGSAAGTKDQPRNGRVFLWDLERDRKIASFSLGRPGVAAVDISEDRGRLAVGDTSGQVTMWDLDSPRSIGRELKADDNAATTVAFSPDGETIATGGRSGVARLWQTRDGAELWERNTGANINSLAWRPDGSSFLAGGGASTLVRLDAATGKRIGSPTASQVGEISAIAVNGSGDQAAIGGFDGEVAIADANSGKVQFVFSGHSGHVNEVLFADRDRIVVSTGDDGSVITRKVEIDFWEREACRLADRNLTSAEAEDYLGGQDLINCPEQSLRPD